MARILYYGGDILTMEKGLYTEAVLVEDGKILAVGKQSELEHAAGERIRKINLDGRTMLPAFIDPHSHITAVAQTLGMLSLGDAKSLEEIADALRDFKSRQNLRPGDWIIGFGYDHNFLEEKCHPDKTILDAAEPDHPVLITHASGHMGCANSKALQALGITAETPSPEGGVIGRMPDGREPNGYLEETAFTAIAPKVGAPSQEQLLYQLEKAQLLYLRHGITTAQEGLTKTGEWALLRALAEKSKLKLDVVSYIDLRDAQALLEENTDYLHYQNRLRIGGYKLFLDGSPQGRTAWVSEPYLDGEAGYCGYPIYSDAQVAAYMRTAVEQGRQLLVHCNGDAAAQQMIDCWQAAGGRQELRPVMIHAQLVRQEQLEEMAELGMIASFFVDHTYFWGDVHWQNFGPERAQRISPVRTALRKGVTYTFHQDSPVIEPNMLMTLWSAVNRVSKEGRNMGEEERLTPLEALRAVTINAAYQYFEEDRKGSIRPGKLADFVILDRNPLEVAPTELRELQVLQTIKEGIAQL